VRLDPTCDVVPTHAVPATPEPVSGARSRKDTPSVVMRSHQRGRGSQRAAIRQLRTPAPGGEAFVASSASLMKAASASLQAPRRPLRLACSTSRAFPSSHRAGTVNQFTDAEGVKLEGLWGAIRARLPADLPEDRRGRLLVVHWGDSPRGRLDVSWIARREYRSTGSRLIQQMGLDAPGIGPAGFRLACWLDGSRPQ
jgi:hypothetical protein